jgi:cobalt-zinc-cadmium efflux system outer membrane protein
LLNLPDPEVIRLQGTVYDWRYFDDRSPAEQKARLASLKQAALANRPDLQAQRWNLYRALADVAAVRASRFDDVTFLVQPYTYSPALPNRVGWAMGVTVPLPIYNRQQGNLAKAQQIVAQTQAQLTAQQNAVAAEVEAAYNAVGDTWGDVARFCVKMQRPTESPARLKAGGLPKDQVVADYLTSLDPFIRTLIKRENETDERNFYNAVIQHRKSLLRMNTACACEVWPVDPTGPVVPPCPSAAAAARTPPAGGGRP